MKKKGLVWVAIISILVLTLGASAPGFAAGHGDGRARSGGSTGHAQGHGYGHFEDVAENDWAFHDITKMEVKSVFGGYGNGRFGPQDSVSCLQLAILAVRITGNEEAALALPASAVDAALSGSWLDASDPVPNWPGARECLAYAYENGYLNGFINQEKVLFRPSAPATRLEVIVTLMDAMGLGEAAATLADTNLRAPDAASVPDWAVGYMALAKATGLVKGDNDGALKPGQHVTRAQMAALLCRCDSQCQSPVDDMVITGRLVAVTTGENASITVEVRGREITDYVEETTGESLDEGDEGTQPAAGNGEHNYGDNEIAQVTFPVSPDAEIFREGVAATLADLVVGDRVEFRLDADNVVIYIDASAPEQQNALEVAGPVVSATYEGDVLTSLTIVVASINGEGEIDEDEDNGNGQPGNGLVIGEEATFAVAADATIEAGGDTAGPVTIAAGDYVVLRVAEGTVVAVNVETTDEDQAGDDEDEADDEGFEAELTATVESVPDAQVTFTIIALEDDEDLPAEYVVGATLTLPAAEDLELTALTAGQTVRLSIEDGVITSINVAGDNEEGSDDGDKGEDD